MATTLKLRRGTTAQHSTFTGTEGEVTVDTDKDTVVVHDGSTAGGFPLARDSAVLHTTGAESVAGLKTFGDGIATDTIAEETSAAGVTVDGVLLKDSQVTTDQINEKTSAAGVTVDGVVLKDNGASLGGNLTFTGTGNRITGDFSTSTQANRVLFQTSTANSNTIVGAIPNGTGTASAISLINNSDPTNASTLNLNSLSTDARILATITGTGTYLPMTFYTSGSERMRIDTSGNVGIGTSSPATKLDVSSTGNMARFSGSGNQFNGLIIKQADASASNARTGFLDVTNENNIPLASTLSDVNTDGSSSMYFYTTPAGSRTSDRRVERMRIDSSGNLLVGTTSNGGLSGNIVCPAIYNRTSAVAANMGIDAAFGMFRSTSSIKYKTNVQEATHGLTEVMALRPVTYKGKNDGDTVFGGLIAEEVHDAGLTEFVQYAEDGSPDSLAYGHMVSLAFKAIQEQQAIIESLKTRLDAAGL